MNNLRKKIDVDHIADFLFCLFLVMSFLSERSILGQFTLLMFITISVFMVVIRGRIVKLPFYFGLEFIFILYCLFQIIVDITVDQATSKEMIQTLLVCSLLYICVYNYAIFRNNFKHVLKLFFLSFVWAIAINMLIDAGSLFESRNGTGFEIAGIQIGGAISISVGWIAGICMVIGTIIYKHDKKMFWFVFFLMSLALLSSGTRKAFLFIPVAMVGWFYFNQQHKNVVKLFSTIVVIFLVSIIGYFITIYNDTLYSIVGYRLENVVEYVLTDRNEVEDASMQTRLSLVESAQIALWERPFLGWGLDNFRTVINNGGYYSHNNFLEILVSGGWIGFFIYYAKYVYVIGSLWISRKFVNGKEKSWINIFLLLAIIMIILEYWQITYFTRKFMIMWVIMLVYTQSIRFARNGKHQISE